MQGERSLLLLLLLSMELPPAPAQHRRPGHRGAVPAVTAAPRRAPRVWLRPAAPPAPGKGGECPAGGSGAPRAPGRHCLSDHGCPGTGKCCQSGAARPCLLPSTESPGDCPRAGSTSGTSCGTRCGTRCGTNCGTRCGMRRGTNCGTNCGTSCGTNCGTNCGTSCGMRCGTNCSTICGTSCHNDTACSPGEKCCSHGCCARCLRAEPAKPGRCPQKPIRRSAGACANRCADDRDCPRSLKCCCSGCGLACTPPCRGSRHAVAKPGACPVVLRGSLGPCLELCGTDSDCPGAAKCCTTGCGHVCKPPTKVHPGLCPPVTDGDRSAKCLLLCLQDSDCPPEQKCCLQGCGRTCVPPLQGTA